MAGDAAVAAVDWDRKILILTLVRDVIVQLLALLIGAAFGVILVLMHITHNHDANLFIGVISTLAIKDCLIFVWKRVE